MVRFRSQSETILFVLVSNSITHINKALFSGRICEVLVEVCVYDISGYSAICRKECVE